MAKLKEKSLIEILYHRAYTMPEKAAFLQIDGQLNITKSLSGLELLQRASNIAAAIHQAAPNSKAPILLFYSSRVEFIEGFFGCLVAGRLATSVNLPSVMFYGKQIDRIKKIFDMTNAKIGLCCSADESNFKYFLEKNSKFKQIQWINSDECKKSSIIDHGKVNLTSPAMVQFTSGSTQNPRGVLLSHHNLVHNLANVVRLSRLNRDGINVNWLPHFHDLGLISGYLAPFFCGGTSIQLPTLHFLEDPIVWLKGISHFKGTLAAGPNFAFDRLISLKNDVPKDLDLSELKCVSNGAEMIQPRTVEKFIEVYKNFGLRSRTMTLGYGLAEATLVVSGSIYKKNEVLTLDRLCAAHNKIKVNKDCGTDSLNVVSCGKPIKDTIIRIEKKKNDDIGEVWVAGPSVISGYWKNSRNEQFKKLKYRGKLRTFFRTNDLGFKKNGQLYIVGRMDDVIVYNGEKIYNFDIAQQILIIDKAIIGNKVLFFERNRELFLVIELRTLKKGAKLNGAYEENLKKLISNAMISKFLLRPHIHFVPSGFFPNTSSGKLIRNLSIEKFFESGLIDEK